MSQSNSELDIVNNFRELLDYITFLGGYLNQINDYLKEIETDIVNLKKELRMSKSENKEILEGIKVNIVTKSEFNDILTKLNQPSEKSMPSQFPKRTRRARVSSRTTREKKKATA